jgi:hypothetical protein
MRGCEPFTQPKKPYSIEFNPKSNEHETTPANGFLSVFLQHLTLALYGMWLGGEGVLGDQ